MKTIVITGAGKGIGLATAQLAAKLGHQVIAISRNVEGIQNHPNIVSHSVDLSKPSEITHFANLLKEQNTHIDILINNAGSLSNTPFVESDFTLFEQIYKVNVFGLAELTRQLLPMIYPHGHVVNISSMGGIQGSAKFAGLAAYSSSKGAVVTLTELLAEEYKSSGPKFNCLALGAVQTEMLAKAFPGFEAPIDAVNFADYLLNFALNGHAYYNGKVLQVSSSTP